MRAKKLVALFLLLLLTVPASSCKPTEEAKPKQGRWVAQYRSPESEKYTGTQLTAAFFYSAISVVSPQVVFVAGDKVNPSADSRIGMVVSTSDGGKNWTERELRQEGVELLSLNAIHFVNANTGWVVGVDSGYGGVLFKTADGGTSWTMTRLEQKQLPTSIYFADEMTGWMAGITPAVEGGGESTAADHEAAEYTGPSAVLGTTDGGQTWGVQKQLPISVHALCFIDSQRGWLCGTGGAIYRTEDGGISWFKQRSELEPGDGPVDLRGEGMKGYVIHGIHFADEMNGSAAARSDLSNGGRLLMTNDGGKTWQKRWVNDGMGMMDTFFVDGNRGWTITTDSKFIYYTSDGGRQWQPEPKEFEQDVSLIRISGADEQHVWAVGGGAIFYRETK